MPNINKKIHISKNKLRVILEWLIAHDDNNRHKPGYCIITVLDKVEKKIRNLKLKDLGGKDG